MQQLQRFFLSVLLMTAVSFLLGGCAAEKPNPLAVEEMNGPPPKQELVSMKLDCRGILNGVYEPGGSVPYKANMYPITYEGNWRMIPSAEKRGGWYMITSDTPGARIDVVATMSRVVFDFWDFEFYDNPGTVSFYIDGQPLGVFDLDRRDAEGRKILDFQVTTQKNDLATVTMIIESGRATVAGYLINFLDERYPY